MKWWSKLERYPFDMRKYQHQRNEDMEDFFAALGVPYIGRKAINMASPIIEISLDGDTMTFREKSLMFTLENTFKLGEEYIETMPLKTLKCVTTIVNDHEMLTNVVVTDTGDKCVRRYQFTENECVVIFTHEKVSKPAKRYFQRIKV